MRYYKAFPEEMKIEEGGATLHDLERTMLSLYWDDEISEIDKDFLMNNYKLERMRYLDTSFAWTEYNIRKLKEVEELYLNALKRAEYTLKRLTEREAGKRKNGQMAASVICIHLEIANLQDTEERVFSDEEKELWDLLCSEDRDCDPLWGMVHNTIILDQHMEDKQKNIWLYHKANYWKGAEDQENTNPYIRNFNAKFCSMKETYALPWQDMKYITKFWQTVDLQYK